MIEFFRKLFFSSDFMPHGHCYFWRPEILWLHVLSDALIMVAYYSIPVALFYFVRKRRSISFDWMFVMFGVFIMACGTTHLLEIVTVWRPIYRLAGLVKLVTAVASVFTAVSLWKIIPLMLTLPSPRQLQQSNRRLEEEIVNRKRVEEALRHSHNALEERVEQRTSELRQEVTARQQAEAVVRASQQQLKNILNYAPMSIFLEDRAGRYLQTNVAFAKASGHTEEDLIGKTSADLFPPETVRVLERHSEQVFVTGEAQEFEETVLKEDGLHIYRTTRFLLPGLDGAEDTLGVVSQDVTERKQAERAIEQAREEAERANRAKSEFLSRMSHELRTPLNAILGFGQLLEMDVQDERQHESVSHILKGGKHLLGLINEVLDISRIESGRLDLTLEPVCLGQVLSETTALLQPLASQHGIQIGPCTGLPPGEALKADKQRLCQVVLNLLSNAVKYNRAGGTITLACRLVPGERLRLDVTDTGHGISPENHGKLFVPFERLGAEHSAVEGTGIGLALSKRLVEAMDGSLGLQSTSDEGSTFYLEMPVSDAKECLEQRKAADLPLAPTVTQAGPTVLYIEDNVPNFTLVKHALEAMRPNVRLLGANQGQSGLDMAAEQSPDLVLLDLQLPDLPGDEVLRRLQTDDRTRHIPVVMVTADATTGQMQRLLALGARNYLTKPLDIRVFLGIFDTELSHWTQQVETVSPGFYINLAEAI